MKLRPLVESQDKLKRIFERDFDDGLLCFKLSTIDLAIAQHVKIFNEARNKYIREHGKGGRIDPADIAAISQLDIFCGQMLDADIDLEIEPLFAVSDIGKNQKLGPQSASVVGALVAVGLLKVEDGDVEK